MAHWQVAEASEVAHRDSMRQVPVVVGSQGLQLQVGVQREAYQGEEHRSLVAGMVGQVVLAGDLVVLSFPGSSGVGVQVEPSVQKGVA